MKKKLMFLAVGVVGAFASANAQPPVNLLGITVQTTPGGPYVQVVANQPLPLGTSIMFNGQMYAILPSTQPVVNDAIVNVFQNYNVVVDLNNSGTNNSNAALQAQGVLGLGSPDLNPGATAGADAFFGTQTGRFTVVPVPFDFGISAVLGAGAIAAVKTARKRRKEQEVAA